VLDERTKMAIYIVALGLLTFFVIWALVNALQ
jgi:hypothetical protein